MSRGPGPCAPQPVTRLSGPGFLICKGFLYPAGAVALWAPQGVTFSIVLRLCVPPCASSLGAEAQDFLEVSADCAVGGRIMRPPGVAEVRPQSLGLRELPRQRSSVGVTKAKDLGRGR